MAAAAALRHLYPRASRRGDFCWRGCVAQPALPSLLRHRRPGACRALAAAGRQADIGVMTALIVWFDGGCPLCRREIAAMQRLDRAGRITFLDVASDATECPIDRGALLARFHAQENGVLLSGAAAFAAMWRAIPLLRPFGLAARNRLVGSALEWLYVRFLRHRPALQRWVTSREARP